MKYLKQWCLAFGHTQKSVKGWPRLAEVYYPWEEVFALKVAMLEAVNARFGLALPVDVALVFNKHTPNYLTTDVLPQYKKYIKVLLQSGAYKVAYLSSHGVALSIRTIENVDGYPWFLEAREAERQRDKEMWAEISAKFSQGIKTTFG